MRRRKSILPILNERQAREEHEDFRLKVMGDTKHLRGKSDMKIYQDGLKKMATEASEVS